MPLSSSVAQRQLSDGNTVGTVLGQSSTDLIGFYGVTTGTIKLGIGGSLTTGTFVSSLANALSALGLINVTTVAT